MRRASHPWCGPWALALWALAGPACARGAQTEPKERKMSESTSVVAREYVGRFSLELPPGFERKGGSTTFGYVHLVEVPPAAIGAKGFAGAWAGRREEIAALRRPRERPGSPTGKVVEDKELGPSFRAVVYHDADRTDAGRFQALLARDGRPLAFDGVLSFPEKDEVFRRVAIIGGAWRPWQKGEPWPIPGKEAFYLPSSAVVLPFQGGEIAKARYETKESEMVLSLTTDSTEEPEKKGLLQTLGESVARAGAGLTAGFSTVRSRKRTAAGLEGEELVLKGDGGKELSCTWRYPGDWSDDHRQPHIDLVLESDASDLDRKLALWDRIVDSLRPATAR